MAQEVSLQSQDAKTSADTMEVFLELVQAGTKEEVHNFLSPQNEPSKQLEDALAQSDVVEVWKRITEIKENKTLDEICTAVVERENNNENRCDCEKIGKAIKNSICYMFEWNVDDLEETKTETPSEEERRWIEILSNPLYISLEWLWKNNPNSQYNKGARRKERRSTDIIEAALDDAYLLEKFALYEHYYKRKHEYKHRAKVYETFAADIVEQVDTSDLKGLKQLHEIMDIEGNGSLLLLNLAADKQRKMVGICLDGIVDLFRLGGLLSHYRPRDILWRIIILSIKKLFIHMHTTI